MAYAYFISAFVTGTLYSEFKCIDGHIYILIWRPPIIFDTGLTHLGSEASIYVKPFSYFLRTKNI